MINNIIIEVYTFMTEQERATILQRQREGIDVAKSKGKHLGRPTITFPKEWDKLYKEWTSGKITAVAFMNEVGNIIIIKLRRMRQGVNNLLPF
ncbi:hypothetical protein [Priestia aryabhattai]|uniref:hypothetical protein n=1 Tax=Priestia aryabhattai TaxID=412384 RepID=UPI0039A3C923